jgi:hypothetical protein
VPSDAPAGAFTEVERDAADCTSGKPLTTLTDLTGDGLPDLVELEDCTDDTVGTDHWRVWPGTGAGFEDGIDWALPAGYATHSFDGTLELQADCDAGTPAFFVDELTGDGVPDLVVTWSCTDETIGDTVWAVYPGGESGFGAVESWSLPTGTVVGAWRAPTVDAVCTKGDSPAWSLTDLDGDHTIDLVVTSSCVESQVGRSWWDVYFGGAGALTDLSRWDIPEDVRATVTGRSMADCGSSAPVFFLAQVDGERGSDLVVPSGCTSLGSDWEVYPGSRDGFEASRAYAAPFESGDVVNLPEQEEPNCTSSLPAWRYDDLDGDDRADLLFVASCSEAGVGDAWWTVAFGGDEGLGSQQPISLFSGYSAGSFDSTHTEERECAGSADRPAWLMKDLDGDGVIELVVTSDCDDDPTAASWSVRSLVCAD